MNRQTTSNGSGSTLTTHLRLLTVANVESARIRGIYGSAIFGTAGGAQLRVVTCATAGTGGTSTTPSKRNPNNPAASLTALNDATAITPGGTPVQRLAVGIAQTGGNGGWVALEPDASITLLPNAGANGNAEIGSYCNAASVPLSITTEFCEGN